MHIGDHFGEILVRLHVSVRRWFNPEGLLADPRRREVHNRLRALNHRDLSRTLVDKTRFVVIDTETTGLKAYARDEIVSIALIELQGVEPTGRTFTTLVNPRRCIPPESTAIHHITNADVAEAPGIEDVLHDVVRFMGDSILVGHHVLFDLRFLNKTLQKRFMCRLKHPWLDTMMLYTAVSGRLGHYTLEEVAQFCRVEIHHRHTAYGDAMATAAMFKTLVLHLTTGNHSVSSLIKQQAQIGFPFGD